MARSEQQITQSLKNSFNNINPSLDLAVGPTYDYTLRPIPTELAYVESSVDRMTQFYSGNFPNVATSDEALDFANNFGISVSLGEKSTGNLTFIRNSPPPAGVTLFIPVGLIIGTVDGQYLFQTLNAVYMLGDYASTYYNPQTNKYEISVAIQSVNPGSIYNLPPKRITKIIGSINQSDFDGVRQDAAMAGGTEPETSQELVSRVLQQFKGINLNSITGIATLANRFIPTGIITTAIVRPSDRLEFRRPTTGPALDLCVEGTISLQFSEEYFAVGGEATLILDTATATSISQVLVNSEILDANLWYFQAESSVEYTGSTKAQNKINFIIPLTANDVVNIIGVQNSLLSELQSIMSSSDDAIFKTDVLVRSFVDLPVTVGLDLKLKTSPLASVNDVRTALPSIVANYIEPGTIPESLDAKSLSDFIKSSIPDVDSVKIYKFKRLVKSLSDVEVVIPLKNEIPRFNSISSSLIVRS